MSFIRVYRDGVWFGLGRVALLLADVVFWVDCCFGSWVLVGSPCKTTNTATNNAPYACPLMTSTLALQNQGNPLPFKRNPDQPALLVHLSSTPMHRHQWQLHCLLPTLSCNVPKAVHLVQCVPADISNRLSCLHRHHPIRHNT